MNEPIIYLVKVVLIQAIFFGCYLVLFRKSLKHGWNRLFLLTALISSFFIPLIETRSPLPVEQIRSEYVITWIQDSMVEFELIPFENSASDPFTSVLQLLPLLYGLVVLLLLGRSVFYLLLLQKLKKTTAYVDKTWFKLFKTSHNRSFSFFSNVFIPQSLFGSHAFDQVLTHECVHVKQRHSIDRLFLDFIVSLFWFNPFIYLYRNALIEIHEYQADEAVIKRFHDPVGYQEVLFTQLQSTSYSGLVSHFNFSMIKKRIVMMNTHKRKKGGWIYISALPVIATVIFAFSSKEAIDPIEKVGENIAGMLMPENSNLGFFKLPDILESQDDFTPSISPVQKTDVTRLTSGFGMRMHPIKNKEMMHRGVDFSCKVGTEIFATADGVIESAEEKFGGYGKQVVVKHGESFSTLYAQLSMIHVSKGDGVKKGDVIALSGNSGASTGPHLHYEVHKDGNPVDPLDYIKDYTFLPRKKDTHSRDKEAAKLVGIEERKEEVLLLKMKAEERKADAEQKQQLEDKRQIILVGVEGSNDEFDPLFVVDGKMVEDNIYDLDPESIKSINVIKGDKAKSKYGRKGKFGVIEVTTKIEDKSNGLVEKRRNQAIRIVIDPGHGGTDTGDIINSQMNEADFSLELV